MSNQKALPFAAAIVAFANAALIVLAAIVGPIVILLFAIPPLCAGIGIRRNRVWSAYGYALYLFAPFLLSPLLLFRRSSHAVILSELGFVLLFSLVQGILFVLAGRSMAASGAVRGAAWPWISVTVLIVGSLSVFQNFEVASQSMEPALLRGDRLLAQTFPKRSPSRGQIILFFSPSEQGQILIKRVIATPGDRLRIDGATVFLNGTALEEKYAVHTRAADFYPQSFPNDVELPGCSEGHEILAQHVEKGEILVPPDSYFVLGDNRENSLDSRCWGFVSSKDLVGTPLMIYDSVDRLEKDDTDHSRELLGRRRWGRIFKIL